MMLEWVRIVGAGAVHAGRRHSDTWRSMDAAWRSRIADVHFSGALPLSYSPRLHWRCEEAVASARGVSSGAAAVLARRRRGRDGDEGSAAVGDAQGARDAQGVRTKVARTVPAGAGGSAGTSAAHAAAAGVQVTAGCAQHNAAAGNAHGSARAAMPGTAGSGEDCTEQTTEREHRARRRTDAVLSLTTQAYEAMAVQLRCARWHAERQEGGRLAHARRRRGDG